MSDAISGVFVGGGADHRGGLQLDEVLQSVLEDLSQLVDVGGPELVEQVLMRHPGVGHRGSPG